MTLRRKLEGEAEIRATAGDVLHDILKSRPHHVSHAASHFLQGVDLHEGEYGKVGSKCLWNYTLGGKALVVKTVLEGIDEKKKYVKYRVIGGDLMKDYKSFIAECHVTAKDTNTCIAKLAFEYEKMHSGVPEPTALMDSWLQAFNLVDDHHHGINKA